MNRLTCIGGALLFVAAATFPIMLCVPEAEAQDAGELGYLHYHCRNCDMCYTSFREVPDIEVALMNPKFQTEVHSCGWNEIGIADLHGATLVP